MRRRLAALLVIIPAIFQSPNELTWRVGSTPPGAQVTLTVARAGG